MSTSVEARRSEEFAGLRAAGGMAGAAAAMRAPLACPAPPIIEGLEARRMAGLEPRDLALASWARRLAAALEEAALRWACEGEEARRTPCIARPRAAPDEWWRA